eukprot:Phypoly_transcript_06959.p1 GENE.Phypoly_transcript_06959~~Phypoly_transcript_06959.p1  ORF type:complete len:349 (+),score=26.09 Phypoly_transcript_06959:25-1071(+)
MNLVVLVLISPLLFIFSWVALRLVYFVVNYQISKRKLLHLPAVKDPFVRLKAFSGIDPSTSMLKENIELAGKGNAFLPVVFVGPYMDKGRPMVMVNSPELIREVSEDSVFPKLAAVYDPTMPVLGSGLVNEEGEHWKKMRGIFNPLFYHNKIKQFATYMTANTDELISYLRTKNGEEVDCMEVLSEATLSVLIDCIFSKKDFEPKWTANYLQKSGSLMALFTLTEFLLGSTLNRFFPWTRAVHNTRKVIHDKVQVLCDRARSSPNPEGANLVEFLVSIQEDGKQLLTDQEISGEAMVMLFAGYDTTKSAIGWTLYFLCQYLFLVALLQAFLLVLFYLFYLFCFFDFFV